MSIDIPDAITVEIIEASAVPQLVRVGASGERAKRSEASLHEEALVRDAERAGLSVVKLLGRPTVIRFVEGKRDITYCFRLQRSTQARAARRRGDDPFRYRCSKGAGWNTHHSGAGACAYHGGNNYGTAKALGHARDKSSRSQYDVARALLGQTADGELEIYKQLDIAEELLLQRTLLNSYLNKECFDEDGNVLAIIPGEIIQNAMKWTEDVTKTVERAKKMENQSALTRAHILYLIQTLTQLGREYVPTDRLEEYGAALLRSFGLDVAGVRGLLESGEERQAIRGVIETG